MDIAAASVGLSTASLQQSVSVGVTKKAMDSQEVQAAGLMEMMDKAVPKQAAVNGLGANVDVRA